jgi:hypothetical protein
VNRQQCSLLRWRIAGFVAVLVLAWTHSAGAQLTTQEEERLKILSDPEMVKKKLDEKRDRPPYEFFKSQVAPFDVLPFVKPNHWSTLTLEMRANDEDYDGLLQTDPTPLLGMPMEMIFHRDARLLKKQRRALSQQVILSRIPKEWLVSLTRPNSLRADASWQTILTAMEPHQALIVVLSKDATTHFATWSRMTAVIPSGTERDDPQKLDRQRYYRIVLPTEPDKLAMSSHSLTWTTTSHVIWDGLPPDALSVSQQQALLDWLHWGGQVIFTGGAGQAYSLYRESFLGPYLPGEPTGQSVALNAADLRPLSQSYPPPSVPFLPQGEDYSNIQKVPQMMQLGRIYQPPVPIEPPPDKPVYLAVLRPTEGASTIPLGEASPHLLAVERRVGRGRITMLTINPTEPVFAHWPGVDTLVRRVVLRRPEEGVVGPAPIGATGYQGPARANLGAQDLTWYRITSRDARIGDDSAGHLPLVAGIAPPPPKKDETGLEEEQPVVTPPGVADWRDNSRFPALSRDLLEEASGISIPSSRFVLNVILAYLIAVVPLNWLICRFALNRREWAWIVVPLVALGFAIGVQRGAAYDMGFESASDELDLLEVHGGYPRAHLSRFASIYTSGRENYTISYPNNNGTALALPLGTGRSIPGEDVTTCTWQSTPTPALSNLIVQPRSLSLFRAEEIMTMAGSIRLEGDPAARRVVNGSELELRDATLIDITGPDRDEWKERYLGTIAAGASVEISAGEGAEAPETVDAGPGPDLNTFLEAVRTTWERRDENSGQIRLVAWVARAMPGQVIEPAPDRLRGFTAVLVHLSSGPPPSPDGEHFNRLALGPEKPMDLAYPVPPNATMSRNTSPGGVRRPGSLTKKSSNRPPGNRPTKSQ